MPHAEISTSPPLGIEFGEYLSDDLCGLMCRQWLATLDLGDLDGEILDGMDAADEDMPQGLTTRFGIVDRLNCRLTSCFGDSATACTSAMASWRPLGVDTAGSRSGFC